MECTSKDGALKLLDALKDMVSDDKPAAKMATLKETQDFQPIPDLKVGDKLRYKGGAGIKFPAKDDDVFVYSTDLPAFAPPGNSKSIGRDDFSCIVFFGEEIREFSADSRYFERV